VSVLDHGNTLANKQDDKWTTHRPGATLLSGYVLRIVIDRFGQVWVGTFDGGLSVYSTVDFQQVYFPLITIPYSAIQP
jgi:ligand-binding sensor domain-containing protein